MKSAGELLKGWRVRAGLSQETLAHRLGHARPGTVQGWEVGRRKPKASTLRKLAPILNVGDDELRAALSTLVGLEAATTPPRAAPRPATQPVPTDPLLIGLAEALARCSPADRAALLPFVNVIRERVGLRAIEPSRAQRRAASR